MEVGSERCPLLALKIEERGHEPRSVASFWKLERARNKSPPPPPRLQLEMTLWTACFKPPETRVGLLTF